MGGAVDKMGEGLGKIFSPDSMEVKGTGQSVGELKDLGYSSGDIGSMGGAQPNAAQRIARAGLGAAAAGAGQPQPQRAGGAPQIQVTPTPVVPNQFDPNYLQQFYGRR